MENYIEWYIQVVQLTRVMLMQKQIDGLTFRHRASCL